MLKKVFRVVITLCGMLFGYGVSQIILELALPAIGLEMAKVESWIFGACLIILFGLIFFKLYPALEKLFSKTESTINTSISRIPANDLVAGGIGLVFGLVIAYLLSQIVYSIRVLQTAYISTILSVLIYIFFGFMGVTAARRVAAEASRLMPQGRVSAPGEPRAAAPKKNKGRGSAPKVLDTSVIIDGRIVDILKTGFIEGEIVIPDFVLVELRHIADSSDSLKRNRGRRGLDILNHIQDAYGVDIYETAGDKSLEEIPEVDVKLLRLAQNIKGCVVTNDFNLNKVATIQGVKVLNINDLANALKPVVLPGESMQIFLVKEGKEYGQAVAYLDDGTMIVVENGRQYISQTINVTVTSVLQTSAGRMIFARPAV